MASIHNLGQRVWLIHKILYARDKMGIIGTLALSLQLKLFDHRHLTVVYLSVIQDCVATISHRTHRIAYHFVRICFTYCFTHSHCTPGLHYLTSCCITTLSAQQVEYKDWRWISKTSLDVDHEVFCISFTSHLFRQEFCTKVLCLPIGTYCHTPFLTYHLVGFTGT